MSHSGFIVNFVYFNSEDLFSMDAELINIYIYAPDSRFVLPYIERELPEAVLTDSAADADLCVMLSHVDVYGRNEGEGIDESAVPLNPVWRERERSFLAIAPDGMILRTADIVGTGMNGFPMELAKAIASGRFFHFPDNKAHRSVIHASDVARVIAAFVHGGIPEGERIYNVTDLDNPTIHDIAEALAFRMNNKRISTLSTGPQQWMGRKWYGRKLYGLYTTTLTFSGERLRDAIHFEPVAVTRYLRTHVYDHDSL